MHRDLETHLDQPRQRLDQMHLCSADLECADDEQ
jgi:hypothetical protein